MKKGAVPPIPFDGRYRPLLSQILGSAPGTVIKMTHSAIVRYNLLPERLT